MMHENRNDSLLVVLIMTVTVMAGTLMAADDSLEVGESWVGNTWGGVRDGAAAEASDLWNNMQMRVEALAVSPDGHAFPAASWDESHKVMGIYSGDDSGNVIDGGQWANRYGPGGSEDDQWIFSNCDGKDACAPDNEFVYYTADRTKNSAAQGPGWVRCCSRTSKQPYGPDIKVSSAAVTGLAVDTDADEIYCSDAAAGLIKVYSTSLFNSSDYTNEAPTLLRSFSFANPGRLTIDDDGNLWIIENDSDPRVRCFSSTGVDLNKAITFANDSYPTDVAFNFASNKLLVAIGGWASRVHMYYPASVGSAQSFWTNDGTLGANAGISSTGYSTKRGEYHWGKLFNPTSVDADAQGNVYVGTWSVNEGAGIQCHFPDKTLRWATRNTGWLESLLPDPADPTLLYSSTHIFRQQDGTIAGRHELYGYTVGSGNWPDDSRLQNASSHVVAVRRISGKLYLFCTTMYSNWLAIFRQETDHLRMIPCGMIRLTGNQAISAYPPDRLTDGDYIWVDANGDGQFDSSEYSIQTSDIADDAWGVDVADNGDVFVTAKTKGVYVYRMTGINAFGALEYSFADRENYIMPSAFTQLRRIRFDSNRGIAILTGYSADYPNDAADFTPLPRTGEVWGKCAGRVIARYNWDGQSSFGNAAWVRKGLLFRRYEEYHGERFIAAMDMAGDYVFLQHSGRESAEAYDTQYTEVRSITSGLAHSKIDPGRHDTSSFGPAQIDIPYGMRVFQRDGSYMVSVEEIWYGKILLYNWNAGTLLEAENANEVQGGIVNNGGFVGALDANDYVRFDNVNLDLVKRMECRFAKGITSTRWLEARLDSPTGTLIGTLYLDYTNDWDEFACAKTNLARSTGTHSLYIVFKGGSSVCRLDWVRLVKTLSTAIEAELADEINGCTIVTKADHTHVGSCDTNDNLRFRNIDFGAGISKIHCSLGTVNDGRWIEFRLDSTSGTLLGQINSPNTGDWNKFDIVETDAAAVVGIHDLYLVFKGGNGVCNLDWISLE